MTADWQQVEQGEILFKSNFFSHQDSDHLFKALRAELPWEQRSIKMFGKSVLQPDCRLGVVTRSTPTLVSLCSQPLGLPSFYSLNLESNLCAMFTLTLY